MELDSPKSKTPKKIKVGKVERWRECLNWGTISFDFVWFVFVSPFALCFWQIRDGLGIFQPKKSKKKKEGQ